ALLGSLALIAVAGTITVDAGKIPYSNVNAAKDIQAFSDIEVRQPALLALVGMYRTTNGFLAVPDGTIVTVTYSDGSKEKAMVVCPAGTPCVQPIPGTQQYGSSGGGADAGGSTGGNGGMNPPGSGSMGPSPPICVNWCYDGGTVTVG
ncbi:MAG: hypothetical protein ACRER3_16850, partial [Pseudomonas fluorescens]